MYRSEDAVTVQLTLDWHALPICEQGGPDSTDVKMDPYFNQWEDLDDSPIGWHITEVNIHPMSRHLRDHTANIYVFLPQSHACRLSAYVPGRERSGICARSCDTCERVRMPLWRSLAEPVDACTTSDGWLSPLASAAAASARAASKLFD